MKKLVNGILEFRRKTLPSYRETFAKLALGQKPDSLYIGCSDSRVAVNVFASTDPGDLFVNRNVGNMVPLYETDPDATHSVAAVIEFAVDTLNVKNIIVCGHSECGAMLALINNKVNVHSKALKSWLRHGERALQDLKLKPEFASDLSPHNRLSQLNVLKQIENLKTYPIVKDRIQSGQLKVHGWWFEIARAEVYCYEEPQGRFVLIDEVEGARILDQIE